MFQSSTKAQSRIRLSLIKLGICLGAALLASTVNATSSMPKALKTGLLEFELERNRYLSTLLLMNKVDRAENPVIYASALQAFDMPLTLKEFERKSKLTNSTSDDKAKFRLAQLRIQQGDCVAGLKLLKGKALKLDESDQQKRAYYRATCFVELGHAELAAQSLSRALSGEWAAQAYYNLAMEYLATSTRKKRALVALKVARELNVQNGQSANELTNRINLNAGKIYLDSEKPALAMNFFDEIPLTSRYVNEGLYLHGFAKLHQNDFRAAAQSWQANLKHALIAPGVAESLLALPLAYAQSGYYTQALEAYVNANTRIKKERKTLADIKALITKYSAREVLVEDSDQADLQWFLTKTGAKNTQRMAYYDFVLQDDEVYRNLKLHQELASLHSGLRFGLTQLDVYQAAVKARKQAGANFPKVLKKHNLDGRLKSSAQRYQGIALKLEQVKDSGVKGTLQGLEARLARLKSSIKTSKSSAGKQLKTIAALKKKLRATQKKSKALLKKLDKHISKLSQERLDTLDERLVSHYEASELGLVTILESVARTRTKRTNLLGGEK